MNKNQENKLTMYEAVMTLLNDNAAIVGTVPAMATTKTSMTTLIQQIKDKGREKREATSGKTQTKRDAEDALVLVTLEVASALYSYARKVKNNELKELADLTEGSLRRLRDTEVESRAIMIHTKTTGELANLADYNITVAKLTELQTKITAYSTALGKRESSVAERSGATQALSGLFDGMDELLTEDLDRLMEAIRATQTEFYNKYFAARVIKDLGIRRGGAEEPAPPAPPPNP